MNLRRNKFLFSVTALAVFGLSATGQTQDTSGNVLLNGNFQFRHVAVTNTDANDNPTEVTATYGTILFNSNGTYTITGTQVDNTVSGGAPQPYSASGTFAIGSNGTGWVSSPLYATDTTGFLYEYGAVSQGVFTGSMTESGGSANTPNLYDIFIAIPAGSAANLTSVYQAGLLDFEGGGSSAINNALFNLSPNGSGGLGTITLSGQASNSNATSITQLITGATYASNSDGSVTLTVPVPSGATAASALFTGTKTMFASADGNFVLGWTPNGYDIFFGVKALAAGSGANSISQGLYFTAALEDAAYSGGWGMDAYYGSEYNTGNSPNGDGIIHQRLNAYLIYGAYAEDYGTDDSLLVNSDGSASDYYYNYFFGAGGSAYVGIGYGGYYSLVVGLHTANFSGTGVYINPVMVYNAASYQPVTAALAPGELITLFGTNLASTTTAIQGGQPAPTTGLGGVTATIDGIPCPVFAVSAGQVSIIVPYELDTLSTPFANIQLTNNGVQSNVVQMYYQTSAPGAFSQTENGLGFAAVRDALSGALIDQSNGAQANEYLSIYLTGLGTVTPTIVDGAVPGTTTLSNSDEYTMGNLQVLFNDYNPDLSNGTGNAGTIQFAGLTPGLAGLYQINVQVPAGVLGSGDDVELEFLTESADVNQIYIPYGSGAPTPLARRATMLQRRAAHAAAIRKMGRKPVKPRARGGAATAPPQQ
jgi:uncharacterized protein (TIGR03437 family)